MFGALAKEDNPHVRTEYLKGIYHFGLEFFDLTFRKDAYANFYRSFEHFVTERILRVRKLTNELKQFKDALRVLKVSEKIIDMFATELYRLRSQQVMHSQSQQTEIEWEDVAKIKLLADVVMQSYYKSIWEADLKL